MKLFSGNIRRRVFTEVEKRVAEGQKEFDELADREDQLLAEGISGLTMAHTRNKLEHESRIVSTILG